MATAPIIVDLTGGSDEGNNSGSSPIPVGRGCAKAKAAISSNVNPSGTFAGTTGGSDDEDDPLIPAAQRRVITTAFRDSFLGSPPPDLDVGSVSEDDIVARETPAGANASIDAPNSRQATSAATTSEFDCDRNDSLSRDASIQTFGPKDVSSIFAATNGKHSDNPKFLSGRDTPAMLRGNSSAASDRERRSIFRITSDASKEHVVGSSKPHNERVTSHSPSVDANEGVSRWNHSEVTEKAREAGRAQRPTQRVQRRVVTDEAQMACLNGDTDGASGTITNPGDSRARMESASPTLRKSLNLWQAEQKRHNARDSTEVETENQPQRPKDANQVDIKQPHQSGMPMLSMRSDRSKTTSQARTESNGPQKYDLEDMKDALQGVPKQFLEDHEYFSKHRLMKARRSHERTLSTVDAAAAILQCPNGPGLTPIGYLQKASPFRSMKEIQTHSQPKKTEVYLKRTQNLFVKPETTKSVGEPHSKCLVHNTLAEYQPEAVLLPSYDNYVSHKQSILAENQSTLLYPPYLSDDSSDEEDCKEVWEDLLDKKHELLWEQRPTRILEAEQAWQLLPYVDTILRKFGCDFRHIVVEKMRSKRSGITKSERNLIPKILLDRLPPASTKIPAQTSFGWQHLEEALGFSIYPVAALLFVTGENRASLRMEDNETNHQQSFEYRGIACRVCHVHNCPFHGHITQGNVQRHIIATPRQRDVQDDVVPQRRNVTFWGNETNANSHYKRPPFVPCNHQGSCEEAHCQCFRDGVQCEKTCACPPSCGRRFDGCNCAAKHGACWKRERCPCFLLHRECDPDLCARCGADEVLDPANRYDNELVSTKCANVGIQRNVARRTLLGQSQVAGFGLYIGEDVKVDDFLGEYTGEIVTKNEAERREEIYEHQHKLFIFTLNKEQDIDATRAGNKFRFLNSSRADPNVYTKVLLCNTAHRVGLYAKSNIKAGEELFFDYGVDAPSGFVEHGKVTGPRVEVNHVQKAMEKTNRSRQRRGENREPNGHGPASQGNTRLADTKQNQRRYPRVDGRADGHSAGTSPDSASDGQAMPPKAAKKSVPIPLRWNEMQRNPARPRNKESASSSSTAAKNLTEDPENVLDIGSEREENPGVEDDRRNAGSATYENDEEFSYDGSWRAEKRRGKKRKAGM